MEQGPAEDRLMRILCRAVFMVFVKITLDNLV